jgi:hypothetical protein
MIDPDDDVIPASEDDVALAELTEAISRRLQSGETVDADVLGDDPVAAGSIRRLLPALQTMVSLGEQVAREEGSRMRSQKRKKGTPSTTSDKNSKIEEMNQ